MTTEEQLEKLTSYSASFFSHLRKKTENPVLKPNTFKTFQINVGKLCNQACKHCHVDASPSRTEIMTKETIDLCLKIISDIDEIDIVDITGGAPELNPNFRFLVEECSKMNKHVIDRCNLSILETEGYDYLYLFLKKYRVEIMASLPHYAVTNTDKQRGNGVYDKSIKALKKLNSIGYGIDIPLNLVYNPVGVYLSAPQGELEREFKENLARDHNITFDRLYCINNMPIGRYLETLVRRGKFETYMETLVNAFNPLTVDSLMCRDQISISWDGYIYDCDFNQMLDIKSEREYLISENSIIRNSCLERFELPIIALVVLQGKVPVCGGEIIDKNIQN